METVRLKKGKGDSMTIEELVRRCNNIDVNGECNIILQKQKCNKYDTQKFKSFNEFAISCIEGDLIGNEVITFASEPNSIFINVM